MAGGVGPAWTMDSRAGHRNAGIHSTHGLRRQGHHARGVCSPCVSISQRRSGHQAASDVRDQTRVWCSDGADLQVPMAASASFPGLVFHAWDEAHSAQRLCANALTDGDEVSITDLLLVTGKKPYSLAKFLTTSMVFRNTAGDQQLTDQHRVRETFRVGAAALQQSGEAVRARKSPLGTHLRRCCHGGARR